MWTSVHMSLATINRNSLNLDAPLFTFQASAQIKRGLQPLIWQDHHRRRKPCVGLRSVRGDQSRQMINKTQLKDTLDVFSCQFRIRLCCIIGRPGRHTDLPETWEPSGEETCELWFSLKSFLFHSSPQRNDWGWWQSSPSFYGWRRSRLGGRIYFKKSSSINRNHWERGDIFLRSHTFLLFQLNLQYFPLNTEAMKEKYSDLQLCGSRNVKSLGVTTETARCDHRNWVWNSSSGLLRVTFESRPAGRADGEED